MIDDNGRADNSLKRAVESFFAYKNIAELSGIACKSGLDKSGFKTLPLARIVYISKLNYCVADCF